MKRVKLLFLFMVISCVVVAQKYTISGFVSDNSSGEKLLYASVYDSNSNSGCISNEYGYFTLVLDNTDVNLVVTYVGFNDFNKSIKLSGDLKLNVELSPVITLQEVTITDRKAEELVHSAEMSVVQMPMQKVKTLPVFMGEADVMKSLQLMPGVQSGQEGASGIYVRGGGPDQNLILLDGVPIYNADHLFGFFSVFNPDAISSVKLIKGGFPARYGGRLSSVVDIRMKEGNLKEYHGSGAIGLISSKLSFEGPIVKDKVGFLVSARRTYIDILSRPIIKAFRPESPDAGYFFHDINTKLHAQLGENDKVFLSVYAGRDKAYSGMKDNYTIDNTQYETKSDQSLLWGNISSALRWNHVFGPHVFSNTTLIFSDYRFQVSSDSETKKNGELLSSESTAFRSGIQDYGLKVNFDLNWFAKHKMKAGVNYLYHIFSPGISTVKTNNDGAGTKNDFGGSQIYGNEYAAYFEDEWLAGNFLTNFGLHYSGLILKDGFYHSLQPRISTRYLISDKLSVKAAYARMQQYLHLLTNSSIGLPTDLWMPCTDKIAPQLADQAAIGLAWNINNSFDLNVEAFYKEMSNLISYKAGASFFDVATGWEDKVEVGKGQSYGLELMLRKNYGKLTGWIGYTLSWAWREFENLNFGKRYPYKYDRRHDVSIALTYNFNKNFDVGATWVYGTGNAITLALAKYQNLGDILTNNFYSYGELEYYDSKNAYRMPSYHRLDVAANFHKQKKWGERTWSVGVYNAYNRQNPFYLYFGTADDGKVQLKQVSLFPAIPFIRYSFKF